MKTRGALLVFEGVDRCGKTTQTKRLLETLVQKYGMKAELYRFPNRETATGKIIDQYLKNGVDLDDRAIHLLFSANRWEAVKLMREKLEEGVTLILDRYAYSGVCFTGAKEGIDLDWCKAPDAGLPAPDSVFFLKLAIEKAMERGQFGEERYEKEEFQRKVLANFMTMVTPKWQVVDAARPIDEISLDIEKIALQVISESGSKPIGSLWKDN